MSRVDEQTNTAKAETEAALESVAKAADRGELPPSESVPATESLNDSLVKVEKSVTDLHRSRRTE